MSRREGPPAVSPRVLAPRAISRASASSLVAPLVSRQRWLVSLAVTILISTPSISQGADVIVDNTDAGFSVLSQTWGVNGASGQYGSSYRWKLTDDTPPGEVQWQAALPGGGPHEVAVWYYSTGAGRPTDVRYTVHHAAGSSEVVIDQQINGSTWVSLGAFIFDAGINGRVILTSQAQAGKTIAADAVRFRPLPAQPGDFDHDQDVDLQDFSVFNTCLSGPGFGPPAPMCIRADFDHDQDVDLTDFGYFQLCLSGHEIPASPFCAAAANTIPPRPAGAITGSAFKDLVLSTPVAAREQLVLDEMTAGNIPDFLRTFAPITVNMTIAGTPHTAVYQVMPDVLAIGSNADYFRMPMGPRTAQAIADAFGCCLPTRRMVNQIYAASSVKLAPVPFTPDASMTTVPVFYQSHLAIENQRIAAGAPVGAFLGGIKKDVVTTAMLASTPGKVAIYGWHQLSGQPIQPLYLGHEITYMDYSHGIRLVRQIMRVDGQQRFVNDMLADPILHTLISDEGVVADPEYH